MPVGIGIGVASGPAVGVAVTVGIGVGVGYGCGEGGGVCASSAARELETKNVFNIAAYRIVMGTELLTESPRVFRAMTKMSYVRCKKKGSRGTRYVSTNFPTPTFFIVELYPAMRASTDATFEDVSTNPETTSPPRATGVLSESARMRGRAFEFSRTMPGSAAEGPSVTTGTGCACCVDSGASIGVGVPAALGAPEGAGETGAGLGDPWGTGTYTTGPGLAVGVGDGAAGRCGVGEGNGEDPMA